MSFITCLVSVLFDESTTVITREQAGHVRCEDVASLSRMTLAGLVAGNVGGTLALAGARIGIALALLFGGGAVTLWAGPNAAAERNHPVSLISQRLVMIQGAAAIPVADLARSLNGRLEFDATRDGYLVQPGSGGSVRFDPAGLIAGGPPGSRPGTEKPPGAGRHLARLYIDGVLVSESIVLQGREPYLFAEELGRLFGGKAALDAEAGQWAIQGMKPGALLTCR